MQLPDRVITALDEALDNNLPPEVPGAAVTIIAPEGEWFGATGVSDLAENTPLQPDDRFEAGSITKTFVATTLLQLTEEDQLSLDDTITDWLPTTVTDLVPNASEITIEQLLNHTSGIADYLDILAAEATLNPALFVQQWEGEQLVGFIDGVEPFFDPGEGWQYSNTNYILAGLVVESVTGNSYGQEIRDRILDPLELDNTFVFGEEEIPGGYIKGYWDFNGDGALDDLSITNLTWAGSAGSIISNTEDLADFFDGLLVDGELLEPETLDEMLDTIPVESPNYDSYGLGIGTLESRNRFWYAHRGQTLGFRSNLWYSPLEDITYVELINGRSSSNLVSDLLPTYRRTITPPTPDIVTYQFEWTGQIAGFSVDGEFSYDISQTPADGIVREENLESFDINFFDPDGNLLRTYEDNHLTFDEFNFAFDTETEEILQDGFFLGEDGFNFGEKTPTEDGFSGVNFWSRPELNSQGQVPPPHVHIDDWADEFGFPIGFSSHEDVAFFTRTTQDLIDTGRVGETYLNSLDDSLDQFGDRINVFPPQNQVGNFEVESGVTSLFLNFSLFEQAGLIIQDSTPTATPFSNQFQLGFEIDESTDFQFQ
ncbi:MAG: serine hydrolase domain-containing protein [Cyanobacteria bacterium J06592_8]